MEAFLAALESTGIAEHLRVSRWGYAAVNGAHVLGVALLVGSVIPLDLRLLGLWPTAHRSDLVRVLVATAVAGLALAVPTGLLLFSVRAQEYGAVVVSQAKLALILVGTVSALAIHASHGATLEGASRTRLRWHAIVSLGCWLGALACGRLIAFVVD
jgi:hypothetical protein